MRYQAPAPLALATGIAIAVVALCSVPTALRAQDPVRHDQQSDNPHPDTPRHDDHPVVRPDDHRAAGPEDLVALRRDHPGATARCHDGFFTKSPRSRACTRHGGIDVWIAIE